MAASMKMPPRCLNSFEQMIKLLQRTGYIQQCLKNGNDGYMNGPAGTLLRHNIMKTWWDRMVVKSEATFPATGHNLDPLSFYHDIFETMNKTLPFSLVHISPLSSTSPDYIKSLPDTDNSRHLRRLLDGKTETSMKFIHVCSQSAVGQTFDQVVNTRMNWWKQYSGSSSDFTQINTVDNTTTQDNGMLSKLHIQYAFPWGQETIETIHNKGDKDLKSLEERSGTSCQYDNGNKKSYPNCIECTTTLEMALSVFLTDAFTDKPLLGNKTDTRQLLIFTKILHESGGQMHCLICSLTVKFICLLSQVLQLHAALAPFKVAVNRDGTKQRQIHEVATYICRELRKAGIQILDTRDTTSTLESQLERYDEMGIPFNVIVNDYTIKTGTISLRNRDTTIHETLAINKLLDYISRHINYQH